MASPEIEAMSVIETALDGLDDDARARVLNWAGDRYGVTPAPKPSREAVRSTRSFDTEVEEVYSEEDEDLEDVVKEDGGRGAPAVTTLGFAHFAELFDHCSPDTDKRRFLVAAFWLQINLGKPSFNNTQINALLREQGHPIKRVNEVAEKLRQERPVPLNQIAKGKTMQAKKVLKLSVIGVRLVEQMIADGHKP